MFWIERYFKYNFTLKIQSKKILKTSFHPFYCKLSYYMNKEKLIVKSKENIKIKIVLVLVKAEIRKSAVIVINP
jgi:hypothetical protein